MIGAAPEEVRAGREVVRGGRDVANGGRGRSLGILDPKAGGVLLDLPLVGSNLSVSSTQPGTALAPLPLAWPWSFSWILPRPWRWGFEVT